MFLAPDFFTPIVNQDQLGGVSVNTRATEHAVFETFGHLKPGVTPVQAVADVDAVSAYLEKIYPKEIGHKTTVIAREGLTSFGPAVRGFVAGLMLLAALILLAACANLGACLRRTRPTGRAKLPCGWRWFDAQANSAATVDRGRGYFACRCCSRTGGQLPTVARYEYLGADCRGSLHLPVAPDAKLYWFALGLALVSGFLFGIVPVRQVFRANPYEIVKAGSSARLGRRITVRDVLLVLQVALCAVLVTSSLVAVRGLVRSLHSNFGFEPRNTMTAGVNLRRSAITPRMRLRCKGA